MPKTTRRNYRTPLEAFEARVERRGDCLVWTGAIRETGYGAMWDGRRVVRPHRWNWERTHGPVPANMDLDHICHNRACVDLDHLRVTSRKQNMENLPGHNPRTESGVRGVSRTKEGNRWRVRVKHNYREHNGGAFTTLAEAEAAAIALRNQLFTHNDKDRAQG